LKTLILAGGVGTRMRPLSCTRPKLLFPILNKPLLDITLEQLTHIGVDGVVLAVKFMANMFMQRYGEKMYNINISYSLEKTPMGTGGAIKYAEDKIGHDEPFLVLNGDIFTTLDYGALIKKHKESNAVATVALYRVKDPSRYGTVKLKKNNQITQFVEKAPLGQEPSNLINAGVYVLDPKVFNYIPASKTFSIEREVFPKLAAEGKMFGHEFKEIWIDIGKPIDYIRANRMLFDSEKQKRIIGKNVHLGNEVTLSDPVRVDSEVSVGRNTTIGSYTVIGKNTSLGKNVCIQGSIVFPGVTIEDNAIVNDAIIGEGALIGAGAKISEECIIGDYAIIHSNVVLERNVTVCHSKEVKQNIPESKRII
jgi:mannose-1-phosphate guanylyltransferase